MIEYKTVSFDLKKTTEEGQFEGYITIWNEIDSSNDRTIRGAFKKTLREKKKFPFLWQHDQWDPIGSFVGKENDTGVFINGELNLMLTTSGVPKVPTAHKAHALMLNGDLKELSYGYDPLEYDFETDKRKGKIRNLKEVRLWESSVVTWAMLESARITDVKQMQIWQNIRKMIESGDLTKEQILEMFKNKNEPTSSVTRNGEPTHSYSLSKEAFEKLRKEVLKSYG